MRENRAHFKEPFALVYFPVLNVSSCPLGLHLGFSSPK